MSEQETVYRIAILTVSDKGFQGQREDLSGPAIQEMLAGIGKTAVTDIVPDERQQIADKLREWADSGCADLILTTGGTGLSSRDVTPEATLDIIERLVPGIPEAIRARSLQFTDRAMLSRAVAGTRGQTLIVNLPGSPKSVRECLAVFLPVLRHGLDILTGHDAECARKD